MGRAVLDPTGCLFLERKLLFRTKLNTFSCYISIYSCSCGVRAKLRDVKALDFCLKRPVCGLLLHFITKAHCRYFLIFSLDMLHWCNLYLLLLSTLVLHTCAYRIPISILGCFSELGSWGTYEGWRQVQNSQLVGTNHHLSIVFLQRPPGGFGQIGTVDHT